MSYKPSVPDTTIEYTCLVPFDHNGTFQPSLLVTMSSVSTYNGFDAIPFDGCAEYSLIVSIEVPTASAAFHIFSPQITVFDRRIYHNLEGRILSFQAANHDLPASSILNDRTALLLPYRASFTVQAALSQSRIVAIYAMKVRLGIEYDELLMAKGAHGDF